MNFFRIAEDNYNLQANLFSASIHLALFIFMIFTIQWNVKTPYYAEVELWDTVPTKTIKSSPAEKPKPKPKKIVTTPPPPKKAEPANVKKEADIKLKKKKEAEKKAAELKKQKQIEELQKKIQEEEKLKQLQKELLEQEKIKQVQNQIQEEEKLKQLQQKLDEEKKLEQIQRELRDKDLSKKDRIAVESDKDVLGGMDSSELAKYKTLIQQKIHQNVNRQLCGLDLDVELIFKISLMPTGDLLGDIKMLKSSAIPSCDQAVERAILQSQPLPLPKDGRLFDKLKNLELKFQPNAIQ